MEARLIPALPKLEEKMKVCAYARVSTGKDSMLHSLAAQVNYYSSMIQSRNDWSYVGVYSDEAMTGTKSERPGFQRMMADALDGKINMIITKSISRFARNTVTLLESLRTLKEKNVDIFFEEQNIHSISAKGELMITLFASLAQEESRSVSENMKWRIKKEFEEGNLWGGADCYGYKVENKKFIINPEEAELVKRIFEMYVAGLGTQAIANKLNEEGIKPKFANLWNKSTINLILTNYNYTGDLILQKTFRENHLTKLTKINRGEFDKYLVSNHHEPIISKELFELAQKVREERIHQFKSIDNSKVRYPYSGKIICGCCGDRYRHKRTKYSSFWVCNTFNTKGKVECQSKVVTDNELDRITLGIIDNLDDIDKVVDYIEVQSNNTLIYHLLDGSVMDFKWNDKSRKDSWTPEMKEKARQKTLERNRKNGNSNKDTSNN